MRCGTWSWINQKRWHEDSVTSVWKLDHQVMLEMNGAFVRNWLYIEYKWLVVSLPSISYFPINIGFLIIPTDFHIFQRGGPTTNQLYIEYKWWFCWKWRGFSCWLWCQWCSLWIFGLCAAKTWGHWPWMIGFFSLFDGDELMTTARRISHQFCWFLFRLVKGSLTIPSANQTWHWEY